MTIRSSPSAFSSRNNTKKNGTLNKRKAIATFFPLHWYQQLVTDLHSTRLRNLQLNLSLNLPVNSPNLPGPNKKVINNRINQSTAVQKESIISIKNIHFKCRQTNAYHSLLNQFSDPCRQCRLIFLAIPRSSFCQLLLSSDKHHFCALSGWNKL